MNDDLSIPACLRRPIVAAPVQPEPVAPRPTAQAPAADTTDLQLRQKADWIWRNWMPTYEDRKRPRKATILKRLRAEHRAAEKKKQMKIGPKELQLRDLKKGAVKAAPAKKTVSDVTDISISEMTGANLRDEPPNAPAPPTADNQESDMDRKTKKTATKKAAKAKARTSVKAKTTAKKKPGAARARFDWKGAEEKAKAGTLPTAPDFSAATHQPYAATIAEVIKAAKAGDKTALAKIKIKPVSSTPKALDRYRKIAITAIENKKAA